MGKNDKGLRRQHNEETLQFATNHTLKYDGGDITYLEEHSNDPDYDTAIELGRTFEAVQRKRQYLRFLKENETRMPNDSQQKPMRLGAAVMERNKQLHEGVSNPTIRQVAGGYIIVPQQQVGGENGTMAKG